MISHARCLAAGVALFGVPGLGQGPVLSPRACAEDETSAPRPGDLLFKPADIALATRIAARWSDGDERFGHVGIIGATDADTVWVIHADSGTAERGGAVKRVTLAEFMSDTASVGHFRPDWDGVARDRAVAYAETALGLPFDRGFSLETPGRLYCTELVWRALNAGYATDVLPEKSQRGTVIYVALSDLSQHPRLRELGTLSRPGDP